MRSVLLIQGGNERELDLIRRRNIEIERDFNALRVQDGKCQKDLAELRGRMDAFEKR
jgi:hypothetical protein